MLIAMTKPSSRKLTDPDLVALRLREYMGGRKFKRTTLVAATGINRTSLGAKLDGKLPFTYNEMDLVLAALDLTWGWLVTGEKDEHPNYPLNGAGRLLAEPFDLREPSHYKGLAGASNPNLFSLGCGNARGVRFQQTLRQSPVKLQVSALRRAAHSVHLTHSHTSPINLVAV